MKLIKAHAPNEVCVENTFFIFHYDCTVLKLLTIQIS